MKFHGKLLLFGEYTVISGANAIAFPFHRFSGELMFQQPKNNGEIESNHIIKQLYHYFEKKEFQSFLNLQKLKSDISSGLFFKSDIPEGYGLGSSGALSASIFREYFTQFQQTTLKPVEIQNYLSKIESYFHGQSSGIDPLVSYLNHPLLIEDGKVQLISPDIKALSKEINFFLVDTGQKRETSPLIEWYKNQLNDDKFKDRIKSEYLPKNTEIIQNLLSDNVTEFINNFKYISMLQNEIFNSLIPKELVSFWKQGLRSGDYFLKLCGAGGGGYLLGITIKSVEEIRKKIMFPLVEYTL